VADRPSCPNPGGDTAAAADRGSSNGTHRTVYVLLGIVVGLVLLFVLLHLAGRGLGHVHGG
jgi:threonine/homoserine/homoserine lactone efflux protein